MFELSLMISSYYLFVLCEINSKSLEIFFYRKIEGSYYNIQMTTKTRKVFETLELTKAKIVLTILYLSSAKKVDILFVQVARILYFF